MDLITPTPPGLTWPTLPDLPAFTVPDVLPMTLPAFSGSPPEAPADTMIRVLPFVNAAYASVMQDRIDGVIADLSHYQIPSDVLLDQWRIVKDKIFQQYHRQRKQLLQAEGHKNHLMMPGHVHRTLVDLSLAERRELHAALLSLTENGAKISLETMEAALSGALTSDALKFDEHQRLQAISWEVARAMVDADIKGAQVQAQAYNQSLELVKIELDTFLKEQAAQLSVFDRYQQQLAAAVTQGNLDAITLEAYRTAVSAATLEQEAATLEYDLYLLQLSHGRAAAQYDELAIQLVTAQLNAVTAQYRLLLSGAQQEQADLESYRADIALQKVQLENRAVQLHRQRLEVEQEIKSIKLNLEGKRAELAQAQEVQRQVSAVYETGVNNNIAGLVRSATHAEISSIRQAAHSNVTAYGIESEGENTAAEYRIKTVSSVRAEVDGWLGSVKEAEARDRINAMMNAAKSAATATTQSTSHRTIREK